MLADEAQDGCQPLLPVHNLVRFARTARRLQQDDGRKWDPAEDGLNENLACTRAPHIAALIGGSQIQTTCLRRFHELVDAPRRCLGGHRHRRKGLCGVVLLVLPRRDPIPGRRLTRTAVSFIVLEKHLLETDCALRPVAQTIKTYQCQVRRFPRPGNHIGNVAETQETGEGANELLRALQS